MLYSSYSLFFILVFATACNSFKTPLLRESKGFANSRFSHQYFKGHLASNNANIPERSSSPRVAFAFKLTAFVSFAGAMKSCYTSVVAKSATQVLLVESIYSEILTGICAIILESAASRNRLDGTTFKVLNLGLLLKAIAWIPLIGLTSQIYMLRNVVMLLSALTVAFKFGLPNPKIQLSDKHTFLYCVPVVISIIDGLLALKVFNWNSVNAQLLFLFPAIYIALAGAATAGSKRLSSITYKRLNFAMILHSCLCLFEGSVLSSLRYLGLVAGLIAATLGLWRGVTYSTKG